MKDLNGLRFQLEVVQYRAMVHTRKSHRDLPALPVNAVGQRSGCMLVHEASSTTQH